MKNLYESLELHYEDNPEEALAVIRIICNLLSRYSIDHDNEDIAYSTDEYYDKDLDEFSISNLTFRRLKLAEKYIKDYDIKVIEETGEYEEYNRMELFNYGVQCGDMPQKLVVSSGEDFLVIKYFMSSYGNMTFYTIDTFRDAIKEVKKEKVISYIYV